MTANPILVEVTRSPLVESRHRGALCVCGDDGRPIVSVGDVAAPVYPRSAVKGMQALAFVEAGAADAFLFSQAEIALACSSHTGEPAHVEAARAMLSKAGLDESFLECGPQPPAREEDRLALARAGAAPGAIHNNCSGKHAGMLALARHMGVEPRGYSRPGHPVQQRVRQVMEQMTGVELTCDACGVDGCSVPTWAAPLSAWARAFATLATGQAVPDIRAAALGRIRSAAASHPFMIAGTGRFCTRVMEAAGNRAFVKTGAEGVFCAALPRPGFGVALKIDDGAARASEALMAAVLVACADLTKDAHARIGAMARPPVVNRNARAVGEIRVAAEVREAIAAAMR
jgi:L-asparaginase II